MIVADDNYYETLEAAEKVISRCKTFEHSRSDAISLPFAIALLVAEEARQVALGDLGEALMKDGESKDWHIEHTSDILSGRVEV